MTSVEKGLGSDASLVLALGKRRGGLATLLFTDLVGSTALKQSLALPPQGKRLANTREEPSERKVLTQKLIRLRQPRAPVTHFRHLLVLIIAGALFGACLEERLRSAGSAPVTNGPTRSLAVFDPQAGRLPQLIRANYIELSNIVAISKFRSAEGHDFSDDFESCRSMKHYFKPGAHVDWSRIQILSPVAGVVSRVEEEWAGTRVDLQPEEWPAFVVSIFHVRLDKPLHLGDKLVLGEILGNHFGRESYSDIAVTVATPQGKKLVSYFEVLSEEVFDQYRARGLCLRSEAIISKEDRDANPLTCHGGKFSRNSDAQDWITLSELK